MAEPPILGEDYVEETPAGGERSATAAKAKADEVTGLDIAPSDAMDQRLLNVFLRAHIPSVVALVGEQDSGKTTLLAELYGHFCRGPIGPFTFQSSQTLIGFAKQHHLALLSSGLGSPKTPRTSRSEPASYYHLAVRRNSGPLRQLIISDRSGETYEAARTNTSLLSELIEFSEAKRIVFLLDSDKLTNVEFRANYSREMRQMLRALRDNKILRKNVPLELLTTKLDHINQVADQNLVDYLTKYEAELHQEFSKDFMVERYRICALPKKHPETGVIGLEQILERWTSQPSTGQLVWPSTNTSRRQIDLLARAPGD